MNKKFILSAPLTRYGKVYNVKFHADENRLVTASVYDKPDEGEEQKERPVLLDLHLCDLSGRLTRVPYTVIIALNTGEASPHQTQIVESFTKICLARLLRSTGCVSL